MSNTAKPSRRCSAIDRVLTRFAPPTRRGSRRSSKQYPMTARHAPSAYPRPASRPVRARRGGRSVRISRMPFPPPLPRPRRARRMVPRVAGAMERRQGLVFGEVADEYDDVRPGYPAVLARAVVEYARDPAWFVEVGAGTGKATAAVGPYRPPVTVRAA